MPASPAPERGPSSGVGIRLVAALGALVAGVVAVVLIVDLVRSVLG